MPRRYADYPMQFADSTWPRVSRRVRFRLSQLVLLYIVVRGIRGIGPKASENYLTPRTTGWSGPFPRRLVPHFPKDATELE